MADRFLTQLPADSSDPNVRTGDLLLVNRGGTDYKALASGNAFVPAATAAEGGKFLGVDDSGVVGWRDAIAAPVLTRLWTGSFLAKGSSVGFTLDTGKRFSDYKEILITAEYKPPVSSGTAPTIRKNVLWPIHLFGAWRPSIATTLINTEFTKGTNDVTFYATSTVLDPGTTPLDENYLRILFVNGVN